jgi:KipI family sensor histidine kinase inhibitor
MKNKLCMYARYLPFGDSALLVEFGNNIDPETNQKVISLDRIIQKTKIEGVEELVPTYRSLLIRYNPLKIDYETLVSHVKTLENTLKKTKLKTESRNIVIPVVYGGEYGPDLEYVAERHGLTREKVIELHSERQYRVYMIGFVAGFPYLGEVTDEISTPRLETPRLRVPAGSVGIAEKQTGVYPCEAPGGWRIIGRTPLKLFNPSWQPPALLKSGDAVRFKPISETEFKVLAEGQ